MAFFIFVMIAVGMGVFFQKCHTDRIKGAVPYTAEVISLQEKITYRRGVAYTMYRPMVRYNNGSKDIIAEHYMPMRAINFSCQPGDTLTVFADPRLPKSFFFPEGNHKLSYEALVCFIAAGLLAVCGIVMFPVL